MSGQRNRRPAFTLVELPAVSKRERIAFTLVELLVVIGIIAVLIGILLPALGKARRSGKSASCISNIRQLVMAEMQYVNENKGRFSPYYNGGSPSKFQIEWISQMAPTKTGQFDKVRLCPEAADENMPWHSDDNSKNQPGGAFYCWGPGGQALTDPTEFSNPSNGKGKKLMGSYGYNGFCLRIDDSGNNKTLCQSGQAKIADWLWVPPMKTSHEIPLIFDSTWPTAWPKETDTVPANLYGDVGTPPTSLSIGNNLGQRVCIARHQMAINVGFLDGHVQTVPLPDLWKLKWHRNWDTNHPQIGPTDYPPTSNTPTYGSAVDLNNIRTLIKQRYHG